MKLLKQARLILLAVFLFSTTVTATPDLTNPDHLESFSDGVMFTSMQNHHVAGAVVSVVADGNLIFSKGYGYSDVEKELPVDPEQTLFRIASVTKLLTWTALMQLYEQNRIKLDTDINEYLEGIEIPTTFDTPITIRHLMSHTPGFEDDIVGLLSRDEADMRPFIDILKEELPKRVRPSGQLAAYSNHSTALAAVIVEQVSGQDWGDYIETRILKPLGMDFTSVKQPLPASLTPSMSHGYRWLSGRYKKESFEYFPLTPAGGGSASANDMSRFMQMFLNGGEFDGVRILEPDTAKLMQQGVYQSDPRLSGNLHGFYETNRNGQRIFGHGGDTIWFHSQFMLLPESGVGVFISTNTETGVKIREDYINAFLERFFPHKGLPKSSDFEATDLDSLIGSYTSSRASFTDFTKLRRLLSAVKVDRSSDGQLVLKGLAEPQYYVEIDRGLFQRVDQDQKIAFRFDERGNATHLFLNHAPVIALERLSALYSPTVQYGIITLCGVIFLWVLIAWPIQHLSSRWTIPASLNSFRLKSWLLAFIFTLQALGFAIVLHDAVQVVFGLGVLIKVLLIANFLIPLVTLAMAIQIRVLLRERDITLGSRLFYISVILAGATYSCFLYTWRMFGY